MTELYSSTVESGVPFLGFEVFEVELPDDIRQVAASVQCECLLGPIDSALHGR